MDELRQDVRYAVRGLLAAPAFALIAILSIALGIGANTTAFSFVNAVFFSPLPFPDADGLVDVYEHHPTEVCAGCGVGTSFANYVSVRDRARTITNAAAYGSELLVLAGDNGPSRVRGGTVTAGLLETLGVTPVIGRILQPADDRPGAPAVVVINENIWRSRFNGDPEILGRGIRVNGETHTVIGVLPASFGFPDGAEAWVALGTRASEQRGERAIGMLGRVAPGIALPQVEAELATITASLQQEFPESNAGWSLHAATLRADLASDFRDAWLLLIVVGFVLLVACANLAGLLLARGAARRRELGVRLSLGAARSRLIRQLLTESLVLALAGGALGILMAAWSTDILRALTSQAIPYWANLHIDLRVVVFTGALTLVTGLAFGLLPAFESSNVGVAEFLKEGGQGTGHGARASRLRRGLVAGEIAAALLLLTGAALAGKVFVRSSGADVGYDTRNLLRGDLRLIGSRFTTAEQRAAAIEEVLERVARMPSTRNVSASSLIIADWPELADQGVQVDGVPDETANAVIHHLPTVSSNYFNTLGVEVISGRGFTPGDRAGAPLVAVVNRSLAERLWPDESALGHRLRLGRTGRGQWITIVGVVANTSESPVGGGIRAGARALAFLPILQHAHPIPASFPVTLHVRTAAGAADVPRELLAHVSAIDPDLSLESVTTVDEALAQWVRPLRMVALMFLGLAGVAVALAVIGIYGVAAFAAVRRTREIGIRMALGATRADAVRLILAEALRTSAVGIAIGVIAAMLLTRFMRGMLFGVSPTDPAIFAGVALLLGSIAMLASYWPARRVMRVDPAITLRHE